MLRPGQFFRMVRINHVLMRHGLDDILLDTNLFRPFRYLIYLSPYKWLPRKNRSRSVRIRKSLEDLGPVFVKFGQMLSTRRDLLADDIADELVKLQDAVPPFPGVIARAIIEKTFVKTIDEIFDDFDIEPLASASIAQVHSAKLKDGRDIVIKVLRPNILPTIRRDLELLYIIAGLAAKYSSQLRRLRPVEVVAEYEKTILDEFDMLREAANASQLKRNFESSSDLYVPEIHWDYTKKNILVLERIYGIPIRNIDELKAAGTDMERLAALGVEIFFTQVFKHNFFHADMHPGNIFVDVADPKNPKYIAVDFGIIGTLCQEDKRYLAENFLAFFKRDYNKVARLHVESGWVPHGTRIDEFESAIRSVCEPIFERPLKEISFGQLLVRLFQTARRFNMEVQPQLVLLQKTLLNIEGLGRQLYPDLDLWQTAKPFLERWMQEQVGTKAMIKGLTDNLPMLIEKMPEIPGLLYKALNNSASNENHRLQQIEINKLRQEIKKSKQKTVITIAGSTLLICAFIVLGLDNVSYSRWFGVPDLTWITGSVGAFFLLYALQDD